MKIGLAKPLALLCCGILPALPLAAAVITPVAELRTGSDSLILVNKVAPEEWRTAKVTLPVYAVQHRKDLVGELKFTDLADGVRMELVGENWRYTVDFTRRGELIYGKAVFANSGQGEMWIEPELRAAVDGAAAPVAFWDGFGKVREFKNGRPVSRRGIKGLAMAHVGSKELPFPASAVLFPKSALHFGHLIFDPVSYSAASCDPAKREFRFSQRFALQPGETVEFNWVMSAADTRFGGPEAAVQQHYDAFPERWAVSMGQDNPYVWGMNAHYDYWKTAPDLERGRRLKQTIDWAYCPYKRAGDIACRKEYWDYRPFNAWDPQYMRLGGLRLHFETQDREEFLKLRREAYRKWGRRLGWMFYSNCAGTWCEIQLAQQHYPDAINNTDPLVGHIIKKWSTHQDREIRTFPMGTSFAKAFEEDLRELTLDLDIPGFALDCASGGIAYRGPAIKQRLPGRAWDKNGVFIDQSVAVNHVTDFIHSIRPGMSVFLNGPLKGDLVMFERSFTDRNAMTVMMPLYKWYIGPRPSYNHSDGYSFMASVANWRNLSREDFEQTVFRLSIYQMFNMFKYGMPGSFNTIYGVPEMAYMLPELLELRRAGWRALIPVKLEGGLYAPYRAVFGHGTDTFLFFGNSRAEDSSGTVTVAHNLLTGNSGAVPILVRKMRNSASLVSRIDGEYTRFEATFPARIPVLYETVCAISGAPSKLTVEAKSTKTLEREIYTATLTESPEFSGRIAIRAIRGFDAELRVNGKPVAPGEPVLLKQGDVITAEYNSQIFHLSQKAIDEFPFTDADGKVVCRVWVAADDPAAKEAAAGFTRFFEFLQKNGVLPKGANVSIVSDPTLRNAAGVVTLDGRAKKAEIALTSAGGLRVVARNGEELERTVSRLLDRMDARYPYVFPFRPVVGMPKEVLDFFGVNGKSLPARKFFE